MIEYALHDDILVAEENVDQFEKKVAQFFEQRSFRRLDPQYNAKLVGAWRSREPFEYQGYRRFPSLAHPHEKRIDKGKRVYRYVNIHRIAAIKNFDLASIMTRSADDQLYTEINELVVREMQNFVTRVKIQRETQQVAPQKHYCRAIRHFSPKNLGTYIFGLGAYLPTLAEQGRKSLGIYLNITGPLNTVIEFWEVPEDLRDANELFTAGSGNSKDLYQKLLESCPEKASFCEFFSKASYLQSAIHPPISNPSMAAFSTTY